MNDVYEIAVDQIALFQCAGYNPNGGTADPTGPIVWVMEPKNILAVEPLNESGRDVSVMGAEIGEGILTAFAPAGKQTLTDMVRIRVVASQIARIKIITTPPQ